MIEPGATIGIVGGGQLGRMLSQAASQLGYRVHIFTNEEDSPASHVSAHTVVGDYLDTKALEKFASAVQVATIEFENIPVDTLAFLEKKVRVHPSPEVLRICQHRIREKTFINQQGIATAPFRSVSSAEELASAVQQIGIPSVLKTAEMGYDGKGQQMLEHESEPAAAWQALNTKQAILEGFVPFKAEISVIVARNTKGDIAVYPPVENKHKHHILDTTTVPAPLPRAVSDQAEAMARTLANALKLVGVLCVEMFVTKDDKLLVNELAPRPHNSGHWTMDACITSQFEQCVRAVCGLPLGSTKRLCDAEMKNLVGQDVEHWLDAISEPHTKLHLYGKKDVRKGRKMGHITRLIFSKPTE